MQHPRFRSGDITTGFIAEEYPDGFEGAPADEQLIADLAVIAGMVAVITDERAAEISDQLGPPVASAVRARGPDRGGAEHKVRIKPYKGGTLAVLDGGELIDMVGRWTPGQRLLTVLVDGRKRIVQVRRAGRDWELQTRGATHKVQVLSAACRRALALHDREGAARSVAAAARADAGAFDASSMSLSATRSSPASRSP